MGQTPHQEPPGCALLSPPPASPHPPTRSAQRPGPSNFTPFPPPGAPVPLEVMQANLSRSWKCLERGRRSPVP